MPCLEEKTADHGTPRQHKVTNQYLHEEVIEKATPSARVLQEQVRLLPERLALLVSEDVLGLERLVHRQEDRVEVLRVGCGGRDIDGDRRRLLARVPRVASPDGRRVPLVVRVAQAAPHVAAGLVEAASGVALLGRLDVHAGPTRVVREKGVRVAIVAAGVGQGGLQGQPRGGINVVRVEHTLFLDVDL